MRRPLTLLAAGALLAPAGCSRGDATPAVPATPVVEAVECPRSDPPAEIPPIEPPATIPTELEAVELRPGTGRAAEVGDTLFVDHTGIRSEDGLVFDSSYARGQPQELTLGRGNVIAGWDQGLVGTRAGSMWRLDVPADLAYGDTPVGDVLRPGDALSFVIEVRAVVPPPDAADAPLDLGLPASTGATEIETADLVVGDGAVVEIGDTAIVHVLLVRGDNRVVLFDTWERSSPLQIDVELQSDAMPGLVQGLQCAAVGGRRVIVLPAAWAFGPDGDPRLGLPAGTDLIVVADVMGVY